MSDAAGLHLERNGAVAHLRFTRPDRANAMTADLWRELPRLVEVCADDASVRALVISAEGRHFSGGMDLDAFQSMQRGRDRIEGARWRSNFRRNLLAIHESISCVEKARFPVLAAIQGGCFGAALDFVCACDLRYASSDAFFTAYEINVALMPDAGTLPRLARLMPEGIVRELVFSGRRMPAQEAERYGFVNKVRDDAEGALAAAMDMASQIAARSPNAMWGCKEMLNYGRDHTTADTLRYIAAWQSGSISFDDIQAAIGAQRAQQGPASFADVHLTRDLFDDGSGD